MIFTTIINRTNKNEFISMIKDNKINIEKSQDNEWLLVNNIWHHEYKLMKEENNYILSYKDNYDEFSIYLTMDKDNTTISKAVSNGKTYKSEKFLKKYNQLMIFANCFTNFGLLN